MKRTTWGVLVVLAGLGAAPLSAQASGDMRAQVARLRELDTAAADQMEWVMRNYASDLTTCGIFDIWASETARNGRSMVVDSAASRILDRAFTGGVGQVELAYSLVDSASVRAWIKLTSQQIGVLMGPDKVTAPVMAEYHFRCLGLRTNPDSALAAMMERYPGKRP